MAKTRVLIIDDSALIRQLLGDVLRHDPTIEVVGTASDPYHAWEKIKTLKPDVLTLDVEMPRMDGLTFLEKLMAAHPMPVLMISSLAESGCQTTLRALELGAVDYVTKPKVDVGNGTVQLAGEIIAKVQAAARARIAPRRTRRATTPVAKPTLQSKALIKSTHQVVAIGASTGGTEALLDVLSAMPADAPGIVVVLHMPANFTKSFAARLDGACQIRVKEAADGDTILPGHALLAPGGLQMSVNRSGASYRVCVAPGAPVNHHCPSVDVLFNSVAMNIGSNAVGAILTGMGGDGARGMLAMRQAGARTIAQDEASCVVFGMPKEAISLGGVEEVLPLDRIAPRVVRLTSA